MITPEYQQQITELHARQTWGNQGWKALPDVMRLILEYRLKRPTILDYGAGERTLERTAKWALPQAQVQSYDPGIPEIAQLPVGQFDIVVCTDVMEHVEEQHVDATLDYLRRCTYKAAFFIIACSPAKTLLPDGRNAHLTIQPHAWWREKIAARWGELEEGGHKNYQVIARA